MEKVIGLGMSGGVDSSVAAYLLKEQGYKVIGITMILIDGEKTADAISSAKDVCERLKIEHHTIDLRDKFRKIVIDNFINAYKNGTTPNPCCVCNKYFKFGLFYEEAAKLGCNYIATGHYARIRDGRLYKSMALEKDQSYFLWGVDKEVLKHVVMPLESYTNKDEIREIASKIGLSVSDKKDSQEVCFIPDDDYKNFLDNNMNDIQKSGDVCLESGEVLGEHQGFAYYTIGQRKGLNISYSEPLYVIKLDTDNNKLIVGPNSSLFKRRFIAKDVNLLVDKIEGEVFAKVRSRGFTKRCNVTMLDNNKMMVEFAEAERAITLGQSVVLYDSSDCCLGGGIIDEVLE